MTVLGDGSGDASTTGVAPEANLVMYALEHDPTGYFGRQGSIYDLLSDAELKTARIAVNAWGSNGNFGSTPQIQDLQTNMFQTINTCFLSFLWVITVPRVHQK